MSKASDDLRSILKKIFPSTIIEMRTLASSENVTYVHLMTIGGPILVSMSDFDVVVGAPNDSPVGEISVVCGSSKGLNTIELSTVLSIRSTASTNGDASSPPVGLFAWGTCSGTLDLEANSITLVVRDVFASDIGLGDSGLSLRLGGINGKVEILSPVKEITSGSFCLGIAEIILLRQPSDATDPEALLTASNFKVDSGGLSGVIGGEIGARALGLDIDIALQISLTLQDSKWQQICIDLQVPGSLIGLADTLSVKGQISRDGTIAASAPVPPAALPWNIFEAGPLSLRATAANLALRGTTGAPELAFTASAELRAATLKLRGHLDATLNNHGIDFSGARFALDAPSSATLGPATIVVRQASLDEPTPGTRCARLSADINLHPKLKQGGSIDGLQLRWRTNPDGSNTFLGLTFEGIAIEINTPTLEAKASLKMYNDPNSPGDKVFEGTGGLNLKSANKRFNAKFRIGRRTNPKTGVSDPYFLAFVDADLGDGVQIAPSLNLYGISLVAGLNQAPNKLPDQPWYAPGWESNRGWYDTKPRGVSALSKWGFQNGAMVIGAGVTVGSLGDNGYAFSGRFLALFLLPGPVVLLEGRANLLTKREALADEAIEPMFGALAAFDFAKREIIFGLDARYAKDPNGTVLTIAGSAETYFDLDDASKWHLYVGKDEPMAARVAGRIFKLWDATAYFMIDPQQGIRTGARLGFSKKANFKVVKIGAELWIAAMVHISPRPLHFHGEATLDGKAWLKVCGYGLSLSVQSKLEADVFRPFRIAGKLKVAADLPWPLPDVSKQISLSWSPPAAPGSQPGAPPATTADAWPPVPRPVQTVTIGHTRATGAWRLQRGAGLQPTVANADGMLTPSSTPSELGDSAVLEPDGWLVRYDAPPPANLPRVPMDGRIQVTFARPMQDPAEVGVGDFAGGAIVPIDTIGDPKAPAASPAQASYQLREVELCRWSPERGAWLVVARQSDNAQQNLPPIGVAPGAGQLTVFGAWGPFPPIGPMPAVQTPDGGEVQTQQTNRQRLWLLSNNPLEFDAHSSSANAGADLLTVPGSPIGDLVMAADLVLDFEGMPAGSWVDSGPSTDGITLSWTGDDALPLDAVGDATALDLSGDDGSGALGASLLFWLDATISAVPVASVDGKGDRNGNHDDDGANDDIDDETGNDDDSDGNWPDDDRYGSDVPFDAPPIAAAGSCITGLHAFGCGCSCYELMLACCPREQIEARWGWHDAMDDDPYGHGADGGDGHGADADGADAGGADAGQADSSEGDAGELDPKAELEGLVTVIQAVQKLGLPFSRLVRVELPAASDHVAVGLLGGGAVVWRARRADASWTDAVAATSLSSSGVVASGLGPLSELELYCCGELWLQEVRVFGDPSVAESSNALKLANQSVIEASIARWGQRSTVLWPDQTYRLRITTRVALTAGASGLLADGPQPKPLELVEDAFFSTSGPPGTTPPSPPASADSGDATTTPSPAAAPAGLDLELPPESPPSDVIVKELSTLDAYVAHTVPAPVELPTPQQKQVSPGRYDGIESAADVIFGDDDVCVDFNADAIEWMYRLARRDLAMTLVGPDGVILAPHGLPPGSRASRFGSWLATDGPSDPTKPAPSIKLDLAWAEKVKEIAAAMGVDADALRRRDTLSVPGLRLPVATRCEARLAPLLLRETFAPRPETEIPSLPGTFENVALPSGWQIDTAPMLQSTWLRIPVPERLAAVVDTGVADAVASWGETGNANDADALGRVGSSLVWQGISGPGGAPLNDPAIWSDVRLSAWMQLSADGAAGLVARRSADGQAWYRLELDQDKAELRCVRRYGKIEALLGFANVKAEPSVPILLSFEISETDGATLLRAWLGDQRLLDLRDATSTRPTAGSVAAWCWRQPGLVVADLRVEPLDAASTPVLRFPVRVAPAANLGDLLDSHDGLAARLHADAAPPKLTGMTWGAPLSKSDVNAWLYAASLWSPTPAPPGPQETAACEELLDRLRQLNLALALPLDGVRASVFSVAGAMDGVLLESPMQLDWRRTALTATATGAALAPQRQAPTSASICDVALGDQASTVSPAATIRVRSDLDLAGMSLERETIGDPVLRAGQPAPLWTMPGPEVRSGPLWRMSPGLAARTGLQIDPGAGETWTATEVGLFGGVTPTSEPGVAWLDAPAVSGLRLRATVSLSIGAVSNIVLRSGGGGSAEGAPQQLEIRLGRPQSATTLAVSAFEPTPEQDNPLANALAGGTDAAALVPAGPSFEVEIAALGAQIAVSINGKLAWACLSATCNGAGRTGLELLQGTAIVSALTLATLGPWHGDSSAASPTLLALDTEGAWKVESVRFAGPFAITDSTDLAQPSRWTLARGQLLQSRPLQTNQGAGGAAPSFAVLPDTASASDVRAELCIASSELGEAGVALRWQGPADHVGVLVQRKADGGAALAVRAVQAGKSTQLAVVDLAADAVHPAGAGAQTHLQVRCRGERLSVWLQGALVCETAVPPSYGSGIALVAAGTDAVAFSDVVVWPLAITERALGFSAPIGMNSGAWLPGYFDGAGHALGQSRTAATSGLAGTSKGWASDGAVFYPQNATAQRELLMPVDDLAELCVSVSVRMVDGSAGMVIASAATWWLTFEVDRNPDETAAVAASWRLVLRIKPASSATGQGSKAKPHVLAAGEWSECPDGWMRWTAWSRNERLRACVDGIALLDVPTGGWAALGASVAGPGHVGVSVGGGSGTLFRDFGVWNSWEISDATQPVATKASGGATTQGGAEFVPLWDGDATSKLWSAATSASLHDGGLLVLGWEQLQPSPITPGSLWLGLGPVGQVGQVGQQEQASVRLQLSGAAVDPSLLALAMVDGKPATLWQPALPMTERKSKRGVFALQRRGDVVTLYDDGDARAVVQTALPSDAPWPIRLGRVGHAPFAISALWAEEPGFATIARSAARSCPARRGEAVQVVAPALAATSGPGRVWAMGADHAAALCWQSASQVRLRLRDRGGRVLHDASFVAADAQTERLAGPGAASPTRLLRSADGTRLFALWNTSAGAGSPLADAETLRLALRRFRDPGAIEGSPAFAAAVPLESSDGDTGTVLASTMLRVVTPPPIIELEAGDVSITPMQMSPAAGTT